VGLTRFAMAALMSFAFVLVMGPQPVAQAPTCPGTVEVQYVCNQAGPEDLAVVRGGRWVIASGQVANGAVRLINVADRSTTVVFPAANGKSRLDVKNYPSCPGPPDPQEGDTFRAHGLYLTDRGRAQELLYVVHHGLRESVEILEVDSEVSTPTFTWIGCAIAPEGVSLNAVVALPGGGFAATNWQSAGVSIAQIMAGAPSGELWEWTTASGWIKIPGSEMSGGNGLEISPDGQWYFIGAWGSQELIKISRGRQPAIKQSVRAEFRVDNLRWANDGSLLAAGFTTGKPGVTFVVRVDPETLAQRGLVRQPYDDVFSVGTVAVEVGDHLWVGSTRGDKIAIFSAKRPTP
jgi:sugar lactone lactonase YvrE